MTREELFFKHYTKLKELEDFMANQAMKHCKVSVDYTVSILEELRSDMEKTTVGWRKTKIDQTIAKIKNDLL